METRANHIWVGAVTLILLAVAAGFALWLAHLSRHERKPYDIYFRQSVDGLAKGTQVNYKGVPAGQITEIELSPEDPSVVRVRIAISREIPVLQGTTATIQGSFTGVSNVQLAGGKPGQPPITAIGPDGAPVIPTKLSGLGDLLSSAPQLLERIGTLTDKLSNLLSDKNQKNIEGILANTNRMTANLADASPQLKQVVTDLDAALVQAKDSMAEFQKLTATFNGQLDGNGNTVVAQLNQTLRSAQGAADALKSTLGQTDPAIRRVREETLPQAEGAVRELRAASRALRELTEKIDNQGAAAALSPPKLPEYHP